MAHNCSTQSANNTAIGNHMSPSKKRGFPKISLAQKKQRLLKRLIKKKPKNKLICDRCEKKFPNWWERREHWLDSGHKTQEQCCWCGKKTFTLQSHICKQHWGTTVMCPNCGYMFMFKEDLKKHQLQHNSSEYRCSHCGCRKKNKEELCFHVQNHFLNEKYGCNICEKRFKKKKTLENHITSIHFICQYCGGTSKNREDFMKHVKIHNDSKCLFCNKVFSQKTRLKYHYQLLHGHQDFYQCSLCFQRFAKKSILLDHLKLKHEGKSKFFCKLCVTPFLYWQQYLNHFENKHLKKVVNKFDCSFCDYSSNVKLKLQCHVEKSSGVGFFCKKCQLRLECKGRFDKHMKGHDGEAVWVCDYCPKTYKSDNNLRQHMLMYHKNISVSNGAKVHPCLNKDCNKYYVTKSSLARHVRKTHAEPKNTRFGFAASLSDFKFGPTKEALANISDNDKETSNVSSNGADKETKNVSSNGETRNLSSNGADKESSNISSNGINKETSIVSRNGADKEISNVSDDNVDKEISDDEDDSISEKSMKSTQSRLNLSDVEESNNNGKQPDEKKGYHHMAKLLSSTVEVNVYYCGMCEKFWFTGVVQFRKHMRSHTENVWLEKCEKCNVDLETPEDVVRHNVEEHLKVEYAQ